METRFSDRGFAYFAGIEGHCGAVAAYESSLSDEPYIWVRCTEDNTTVAAELTLDGAARLRDQLTWLIDNHYQVKPRAIPA